MDVLLACIKSRRAETESDKCAFITDNRIKYGYKLMNDYDSKNISVMEKVKRQ